VPNLETKDDLRKPEANEATQLLDRLSKEKTVTHEQNTKQDDSKWLYVQQCRRGHIAFFYKENPLGRVIGPDGWYSKDKRIDEPWRGIVPCQECSTRDAEGYLTNEEPCQLTYVAPVRRQTMFMPDPRWVYRYGKTPEIRAKHRPHRAEVLNITAANVGVPNPDFPESVRTIKRRQLVETDVAVRS
jgi:hypothetical protein